jgi:hypothetical protein
LSQQPDFFSENSLFFYTVVKNSSRIASNDELATKVVATRLDGSALHQAHRLLTKSFADR